MLKKKKKQYHNAPRLLNGTRENQGITLDPLVRYGLQSIARQQKKSLSWVVDSVLIDYFQLKHSKYRRKEQ
jgi:hypothetical protein